MLNLGQRIKDIRQERGITQSELARRMGKTVAHGYVSRLESDTEYAPSLGYLESICEALEISPRELFESQEEHIFRNAFIREAAPFLLNLTFAQRGQVLEVLHDLRARKAVAA
jgi:transcriptional regulator with XRE-family HTH domain